MPFSSFSPRPAVTHREGFDPVYRRHYPAVFRYALKTVGRPEIAEELAADAFMKLLESFDRIDQDQLPGWLLTVVRHAAVDYWRHRAVEQRYLSHLELEPITTATPAVRDWIAAVPALNAQHRACLILRYVHGCPRAEIARRMNLTETQVKGCLQYARELLRRELVPV